MLATVAYWLSVCFHAISIAIIFYIAAIKRRRFDLLIFATAYAAVSLITLTQSDFKTTDFKPFSDQQSVQVEYRVSFPPEWLLWMNTFTGIFNTMALFIFVTAMPTLFAELVTALSFFVYILVLIVSTLAQRRNFLTSVAITGPLFVLFVIDRLVRTTPAATDIALLTSGHFFFYGGYGALIYSQISPSISSQILWRGYHVLGISLGVSILSFSVSAYSKKI